MYSIYLNFRKYLGEGNRTVDLSGVELGPNLSYVKHAVEIVVEGTKS